jgi:hypothetical protein
LLVNFIALSEKVMRLTNNGEINMIVLIPILLILVIFCWPLIVALLCVVVAIGIIGYIATMIVVYALVIWTTVMFAYEAIEKRLKRFWP